MNTILLPNGFGDGTADIKIEENLYVHSRDIHPTILEDFKRTGELFLKVDGEALRFEFAFDFKNPFVYWSKRDQIEYVWLMQVLKEGKLIDKKSITSSL